VPRLITARTSFGAAGTSASSAGRFFSRALPLCRSGTLPVPIFCASGCIFMQTCKNVQSPPPHLTARAEAIDRQVVGALRCPACRRSGMSYHPFTDGRGHYAVLAVCRCGTAQEV
jgi:hypothetical protein